MKEALAQIVGQRIKEIHTGKNFTQHYMACLLDVQLPLYSKYERGEILLPLRYILEIAVRFNVNPNYILGVIDAPAPYPQNPGEMEDDAIFIPQEPYVELALRHFPMNLYREIKYASRTRHVSMLAFIIQCCEFALESIGEESQ